MVKRKRSLLVIAAASVLLSACGDDGGGAGTTTVADITADPAPSASGTTGTAAGDVAAAGETGGTLCDLLSPEAVEAALGEAPTSVLPPEEQAPNPRCVWTFEDGSSAASLGIQLDEFGSVAEAGAFIDAQVTGAQFSPVPYDGLGDQAVVVDQDTAKRIAARQGAVVVDLTGFAQGRPLPSLDALVALMEEALSNLD
jgi:hypothetical protein